MEKWKKIIVHNKAIVARYEKTSKVYFYGESNFEGLIFILQIN
jgi:hypothetical protein